MHPPNRHHTVYSEIGDKVIAHVRSGSFATNAVGLTYQLMFASLPKTTEVLRCRESTLWANFGSRKRCAWVERSTMGF